MVHTADDDFRYAIDPEQSAWRVVDGEAVLINAETTFYYGLNGPATEVWRQLLERDLTSTELSRLLTPSFDTDAQTLQTGIQTFLAELKEEGLLTISDSEPLDEAYAMTIEFSGPWTDPELTRYNTLEDLIVCGE